MDKPQQVTLNVRWYYSCFISYSSKDEEFANRLHEGLQNNGVRCWFAPHDLPIGAKTWDAIDEAIRRRDKVLLILSKHAVASDWGEDEVTKGFAEERHRNKLVLFPVRIDDTVIKNAEPWAVKLRDQRLSTKPASASSSSPSPPRQPDHNGHIVNGLLWQNRASTALLHLMHTGDAEFLSCKNPVLGDFYLLAKWAVCAFRKACHNNLEC